jgi:hypothetical protein
MDSIEEEKLSQVSKQVGKRVPRELILFLFKKMLKSILNICHVFADTADMATMSLKLMGGIM